MINYFKQKNKKRSGFTLVETLVAISVFSVSIIALMAALGKGISDSNQVKYKMTATYLAEEGIEYIRNMRDTFVLYDDVSDATVGWGDFVTKLTQCAGGCKFDDTLARYDIDKLKNMTFSSCTANICALDYDSTSHKYLYHQLGTLSGFTRVITANPVNPANTKGEIKITSTVSWVKNSATYSVSFSDNLLKWRGE